MITKPRGTEDILPVDIHIWQYIESTVRDICANFGYKEIRTPVFESTELFKRGVGGATDIVQKEMYTFTDKGERSVTLRPEGTASVVRSFIENGLYNLPQPTKLYYLISCYRYEKPQKGRLREFNQFGVECFGSNEPACDAEIISLAITLLEKLGITGLKLNINSIGCLECRTEYNKKLISYFNEHKGNLCETCVTRLSKNPMRILDCKSQVCSGIAGDAPKMIDNLCAGCQAHFEKTREHLDSCSIKYSINPDIVRGLDYYTKTVFEITSDALGAQSALCGGGRYDGMVEELGGSPTPGIGFALGLQRLILILKSQEIPVPLTKQTEIFIASIGESAGIEAQKLVFNLRKNGISAERDLLGRGLKPQMKYADKLNAKYSLVLGDDEIVSRRANLKNMLTGESREISIDNILQEVL